MTQWKYKYKINSHVFSLLITLAFTYFLGQFLQNLQLQVPVHLLFLLSTIFFSFSFPNVYRHIKISSVLIKIKLSQTCYTLQYCCYFSSMLFLESSYLFTYLTTDHIPQSCPFLYLGKNSMACFYCY